MSNSELVFITLSPAKIAHLVRTTALNRTQSFSRSLMRGVSILTCFGPDHPERGILELAGVLQMSPSTTHRYVTTLVELGLLEQAPRSRKYRLAHAPSGDSDDDGNGALLAQPVGDD